MEVIERFSESKTGDPSDMEDLILTTEHFAAVIDGATSKTSFKLEDRTTGQLAAQLVGRAIKGFSPDIRAATAVRTVTEQINQFYRARNLEEKLENSPAYRAIATAAIYSRHRREVWFVGDCQALVDDRKHIRAKRRVDKTLAQVRALATRLHLAEGKDPEGLQRGDPGREFIIPLLRRQSLLQNHPSDPFSYLCFDGFEIPLKKVRKLSLPDDVDQLVLATDGYPKLFPTLEETEEYLHEAIQQDPLCIGPLMGTKGLKPDNKSFDDRAYLRIAL